MNINLIKWTRINLKKIVSSIAFYPALIALMFLLLSYLMIHIDYSELGKEIKTNARWLKLKDASTARTIISVVAAGILSLTVFSFTMVMVILNQAASQMSNRVLDRLINNGYQQFVLGFYIGTIVYSLFLLTAIRDVDTGIYVPSLSTYLLIGLAVADIFFFIYFLHFITQSIKYAVIIQRIHRQTSQNLKNSCRLTEIPKTVALSGGEVITAPVSGIFQGCNNSALLQVAEKQNLIVSLRYPIGTYVLCNTPVATVHSHTHDLNTELLNKIRECLYIDDDQPVLDNFYYGFRQLTEVALRALSPGINDPGTATESLRAIAGLLHYRLMHHPDPVIHDKKGIARIITHELSASDIFNITVLPVWDYGKNDRIIQNEMDHLLTQLQTAHNLPEINRLHQKVKTKQIERE